MFEIYRKVYLIAPYLHSNPTLWHNAPPSLAMGSHAVPSSFVFCYLRMLTSFLQPPSHAKKTKVWGYLLGPLFTPRKIAEMCLSCIPQSLGPQPRGSEKKTTDLQWLKHDKKGKQIVPQNDQKVAKI